MNILKKIYQRMLIDAMTGLSLGLFATLIAGSFIEQIGIVAGGTIGNQFISIGNTVKSLMGIGIGIGVATKLSNSALVYACAAVVGHMGAFSGDIFNGMQVNVNSLGGSPLTAFVAVYIAVEASALLSGKTKVDYLITPILTIIVGAVTAMYIGQPVLKLMEWFQTTLNWSLTLNPIIMGIIVSVLMGISLTLPINSLALAVALNLTGEAAGAATIGCCVNMIGFAVASFRDNRFEGFILQSLGSSTLQMPNIIKNPYTYIPVIATSAILGPIAICVFNITSTTTAAGMGSCGFMAQIMTYKTMMSVGINRNTTILQMMLMTFILPAIFSWIISEALRKKGLIKEGDMKIVL